MMLGEPLTFTMADGLVKLAELLAGKVEIVLCPHGRLPKPLR